MITNPLERRLTGEWVERFAHDADAIMNKDIEWRDVLRDSYLSMRDQLQEQCEQYDAIASGAVAEFTADFHNLEDVFLLLRHLRGLTQKGLGEKLGIKQQQVQVYEKRGYEQVSYSRLLEIAWALGADIQLVVRLKDEPQP